MLPKDDTQTSVQIFILSRDRLNFCHEAVTSALGQTYRNVQVIVSDNSTQENVAEVLAADFPRIKIVKRRPNLSSIDHFNCILREADSTFLVMLHDDDVLETNYIEEMVFLLEKYDDVGAVGCNARIIYGSNISSQPFIRNFSGLRKISDPAQFLKYYTTINAGGIAPFPSYMYRTKAIQWLPMDISKGGKYCDASFLSEVAEKCSILWTSKCLFRYRVHGGNDSGKESPRDRLSFLQYVQMKTGLHRRSEEMLDYKFLYLRVWLLNKTHGSFVFLNKQEKNLKKIRIIRNFIFYRAVKMALTRFDFYQILMWRIARKLSRNYL